jgi:hypothetical protein
MPTVTMATPAANWTEIRRLPLKRIEERIKEIEEIQLDDRTVEVLEEVTMLRDAKQKIVGFRY